MFKEFLKLRLKWLVFFSLSLFSMSAFSNDSKKVKSSAQVKENLPAFIERMAKEHQMNAESLTQLFKQVRKRQDIIDSMNRPAESKPWYKYRPIWINPNRIRAGVDFWNKYHTELLRAEQTFDVPAYIIVGIIGVETYYGKIQGKIPVIDALYTLGFYYPKRADFFRKELEEFLILCQEQKWSPLEPKGSYAGAMGMGQFISSSYRNYAVDFDGDGEINLFDSPVDAIGSVANYFRKHHWRWGEPVAYRLDKVGSEPKQWGADKLKPQFTAGQLYDNGFSWPVSVVAEQRASIYPFKQKQKTDYWIGFENFYVITRYNRSALYALAVYQFSSEVMAARSKAYLLH